LIGPRKLTATLNGVMSKSIVGARPLHLLSLRIIHWRYELLLTKGAANNTRPSMVYEGQMLKMLTDIQKQMEEEHARSDSELEMLKHQNDQLQNP